MQAEPDDAGQPHRQGLPEHDGLGLDPADPPAEDAEAVDHGGVGVGAQADVRERPALLGLDHSGQVLDVDLVHDPGPRRDDGEVLERLLAPLEEPVALGVAAVLDLDVAGERVAGAEHVGDHRVVDHQLGGDLRVDQRRVLAELGHGEPHRREVDQRRDAVGVVQEGPRRAQVQGLRRGPGRAPVQQELDLLG